MEKRKLTAIIFVCLICFSCAAKQPESTSFVNVNDPEIVPKITKQIVRLIKKEASIQKDTLNLVYGPENIIGTAVADELKQKGFALSETEGIKTVFTVDSFIENKIFICVIVNKKILSQVFVFETQTGIVKPNSPLSIGEV